LIWRDRRGFIAAHNAVWTIVAAPPFGANRTGASDAVGSRPNRL
jgi:hypothetical protein